MIVVRRRWPRLLFNSFQGWTKDSFGQDIVAGLTLAAITLLIAWQREQLVLRITKPRCAAGESTSSLLAFDGVCVTNIASPARPMPSCTILGIVIPRFVRVLCPFAQKVVRSSFRRRSEEMSCLQTSVPPKLDGRAPL